MLGSTAGAEGSLHREGASQVFCHTPGGAPTAGAAVPCAWGSFYGCSTGASRGGSHPAVHDPHPLAGPLPLGGDTQRSFVCARGVAARRGGASRAPEVARTPLLGRRVLGRGAASAAARAGRLALLAVRAAVGAAAPSDARPHFCVCGIGID